MTALPTLADVAKKYNENKKTISEKKELGSAYIESIRMLTDNNNLHTRQEQNLQDKLVIKELVKAYEGLMYVEDLLRQANETIKARTKVRQNFICKVKESF